ncbi:SLAM family member 9-like isoform X2 [Pyxicephalus adspersus]|uniref:SLAM family member 9-like isoform X2 n=1 Tax=Pyxicephalus adspersus TaxID=30357 RepID=UPI003B5B2D0C
MVIKNLQNILIVLFLWIWLMCEAHNDETRVIFGTEGGNVTLQLNGDDVEDVSWVYDDHVRVETKPGKPIKIRDPDHKGNMVAAEDASLVILNLSLEDQKMYSASLQLKGTQESYTIHYDLKIYKILSEEDIHLQHNNTNNDPCSVFITCVVKYPNVNITWTKNSSLNLTCNVLYIEDALSSRNVTCNAWNPISNVTKTVRPSEYCEGKKTGGGRQVHVGVIVGIVFVLVVGIGGLIFWKRRQGEEVRPVT